MGEVTNIHTAGNRLALVTFKTVDGTNIYGTANMDSYMSTATVTEKFATHPHASGTSEARAGHRHFDIPKRNIKVLTRAEYNAAFLLTVGPEELDEQDQNASLDDLRKRYPIQD